MYLNYCELVDTEQILGLYENARSLQTIRKMVVWPHFEKSFIDKEITEKRQWKIEVDQKLVCNWAITFSDKEIWGEKDQNNSIYIHRICTDARFYGNRFIDKIVDWAKDYANQMNKRYVRLDTLGNNTKLIEHYTSAGFSFLGIEKLTDTENLPLHYQNEPNCCFFEIDLEN
jgi:ribosomal protein S18 acetylase RimI-like enzyme